MKSEILLRNVCSLQNMGTKGVKHPRRLRNYKKEYIDRIESLVSKYKLSGKFTIRSLKEGKANTNKFRVQEDVNIVFDVCF